MLSESVDGIVLYDIIKLVNEVWNDTLSIEAPNIEIIVPFDINSKKERSLKVKTGL